MKQSSIYLDTNILSRIPDLRVNEQTATAFARLGELGMIKFVTSQKAMQEILKTANPKRNSLLQFLCALVMKVPTVPVCYSGAIGAAPLGVTPLGMGGTSPLYLRLTSIFDDDDAEHMVQALTAKCDYFMTLDEETILERVKSHLDEVQAICPSMQILSPVEVVEAIEAERAR